MDKTIEELASACKAADFRLVFGNSGMVFITTPWEERRAYDCAADALCDLRERGEAESDFEDWGPSDRDLFDAFGDESMR